MQKNNIKELRKRAFLSTLANIFSLRIFVNKQPVRKDSYVLKHCQS